MNIEEWKEHQALREFMRRLWKLYGVPNLFTIKRYDSEERKKLPFNKLNDVKNMDLVDYTFSLRRQVQRFREGVRTVKTKNRVQVARDAAPTIVRDALGTIRPSVDRNISLSFDFDHPKLMIDRNRAVAHLKRSWPFGSARIQLHLKKVYGDKLPIFVLESERVARMDGAEIHRAVLARVGTGGVVTHQHRYIGFHPAAKDYVTAGRFLDLKQKLQAMLAHEVGKEIARAGEEQKE